MRTDEGHTVQAGRGHHAAVWAARIALLKMLRPDLHTLEAVEMLALHARVAELENEQLAVAGILNCPDVAENIVHPSNIPNIVRDKCVRIQALEAENKRLKEDLADADDVAFLRRIKEAISR